MWVKASARVSVCDPQYCLGHVETSPDTSDSEFSNVSENDHSAKDDY